MMMTSETMKIFPKASELNKILNNLKCPEEECTEVFQNSPNLALHLLKTHGKERSLKSSTYGSKIAQYYCPEIGCKYCFNPEFEDNKNSKKWGNRYFTQFKYLKQHYIKVHLDKAYICDKCNKGFPTDLHRSRHYEVCGNKYICSCGAEYPLLASLQTHARREQHSYSIENVKGQTNRSRKSSSCVIETLNNNNNSEYKTEMAYNNLQSETVNSQSGSLLLLPKGTSVLVLHGMVELGQKINKDGSQNMSVSTQTDIPKRRKALSPVKGIVDKPIKKRTSTQTQTGEKRPKKTTETQTSFQCLPFEDKRKNVRSNSSPGVVGRKRKKSMETQTLSGNHNIINNQINENNSINVEFRYSSHSEHITNDKNSDESNSLDNSITQKDFCLPQLWLSIENENINKMSDKDISAYLTNNSIIKTNEIVSEPLPFGSEKKITGSLLSFDNDSTGLSGFDKGSIKESNSCHIETQTDSAINSLIDDYLTNCENGIPEDDLLDQYTRWTQTCDDIILPDDIALDFTNNETQTAWSLCDDSFISDVVNSETQTPLLNIDDYIIGNQ